MALQAQKMENGIVELWDFSEGGGPLVRCFPDGRIELYEIPQYGGEEVFYGNFNTVCAALEKAASWT